MRACVYKCLFLSVLCLVSSATIAEVAFSSMQLVSSARVDRNVTQFVYRVTVSNYGRDISALSASVASTSTNTRVVDGQLSFPDIKASSNGISSDTFSINHDRRVAFDAKALRFTFSFTEVAISDIDGDGVADSEDTDRDGDGVANAEDVFPNDRNETADLDGDGIGDNADNDRDGDGVANAQDAFPNDRTETADLDGDGTGDNADNDRDGDGVANIQDAFPTDRTETADLDGDGTGDNADPDRDGDGLNAEDGDCNDSNAQHHPRAEDIPNNDIDENCDGHDATGTITTDRDGDGFADDEDAHPDDPSRFRLSEMDEGEGVEGGAFFQNNSGSWKLHHDPNGGVYPLNEMLVVLDKSSSYADIQEIADSYGGRVTMSNGLLKGGSYILNLDHQVYDPESDEFVEVTRTPEEFEQIKAALELDRRIHMVLPNYISSSMAINADLEKYGSVSQQGAYQSNKIQEAWHLIDAVSPTLTPVNVLVIDSVVRTFHQEFNHTNVYNGDSQPPPDASDHGTAVAGIIAAENDGIGMNGILTANVGVMGELHSDHNEESALHWVIWMEATSRKIDVANFSHGFIDKEAFDHLSDEFPFPDETKEPERYRAWSYVRDVQAYGDREEFNKINRVIAEHLTKAAKSNPNFMLVVAAGNLGVDAKYVAPASLRHPNLITVGSVNFEGQRSKFSNKGASVDIAANGEHVYVPNSTLGMNGYSVVDGTSFSAPMVSGIIGLMLSIQSNASAADIKEVLIGTADAKGELKQVNAARAVGCMLSRNGYRGLELVDSANPLCRWPGADEIHFSSVMEDSFYWQTLLPSGLRLYNMGNHAGGDQPYVWPAQVPLFIPIDRYVFGEPMVIAAPVGRRIVGLSFTANSFYSGNIFIRRFGGIPEENGYPDIPELMHWLEDDRGCETCFGTGFSLLEKTPTYSYFNYFDPSDMTTLITIGENNKWGVAITNVVVLTAPF